MRKLRLTMVFTLSLLTVAVLTLALSESPAQADPAILYVRPDCTGWGNCYTSIQSAVNAASPGDEILIATGIYTGVQARDGITQVVYIGKSLILRGGYTADFSARDPALYPTTVDARRLGRAMVISGPVTATLDGLRLTGGNVIGQGGGGLYISSATVTVSDCHIFDNSDTYTTTNDRGGGIYVHNGSVLIRGSQIYSNIAAFGGGIAVSGGRIVLTETVISGNTAVHTLWTGFGGGLHVRNGTLTGVGVEIAHNKAAAGGGLHLSDSDATLAETKIHHNRSGYYGGGFMADWSTFTITDGEIYSNTAEHDGGGGWVQGGWVTLTGCDIHHNRGRDGGGLYRPDRVEDSAIHHNRARQGGGLYLTGGNVNGSAIYSNTAREGGGIYSTCDAATFDANRIFGNTAGLRGGGLCLDRNGSVWLNTVVARNRLTETEGLGSGIYLAGYLDEGLNTYFTTFYHTTLADNSGGDGVGVLVTGTVWYAGRAAFINTIIAKHFDGAGVRAMAGSTVTLEATLWYANGSDTDGPGHILTGTVNLHADPRFADPAAADYHLTYGSPARDAGLDVGVSDDLDGEPRPVGDAPDIGADEYPFAVLLTPPSAEETVAPGGWHIYNHMLQNIGAVTDTFTLTLSSSRGWVSLSGSPVITLGPGGIKSVSLLAQVPADAPGLARDVARLKAVSLGDPAVAAEAVDTTTATCTPPGGVSFTWAPTQPKTGQAVYFTATATGSPPLTYTWDFGDGSTGPGEHIIHTYLQNGTYTVSLTVANPCGQDEAHAPILVTGTAVPPARGVEIVPTARSAQARPGETVVFTHTLRNTGNVADTYTVTVSSNRGWASLASPGTVNLDSGGTATVKMAVTLPPTVSGGIVETATVEAISWAEPTVRGSATDTVTATEARCRLYLPLVLRRD